MERTMRRFSCVFALIAAAAILPASAFAQTSGKAEKLTAEDGWEIHITYYASDKGEDSPVVMFLHGEKQDRRFWDIPRDSWPKILSENGVACVTVDLRKHGESNPEEDKNVKFTPYDYKAMVAFDLEEVKHFIFKEHQAKRLNMRKMAIVCVDDSAPVALQFAAEDWLKRPWSDAPILAERTPRGQDIRAIVMVSPRRRVPGLSADAAINVLKNDQFKVATLVMYCKKDPEDKGDGHTIAEKFAPRKKVEGEEVRNYELALGGKLRGFQIISESTEAKRVFLGFINKHLKSLDDEWVNRKSPADTRID